MRIRKTTEEDFDRVMKIYSYARDFMAKTGNPNQWGPTNWPPETLIHDDIKEGNSYVCLNEENKVIGTFYFIQGKDIEPTYRKIEEGEWIEEPSYGVVHRLASDGSEKGIGRYCLDWAFEQCGHLRVDTHTDNKVMQNILEKLGFIKCGIIHVIEDNYPRFAYEKI
ncbi:MAG: GNAT family N-acetyltransferase [Butyrivibrio sp.]|nr:GNAT family N-acetyltransferase [Butyrivibrio sp.]